MKAALALLAVLAAPAAAQTASFGRYDTPPLYDSEVTTSFYLPMRDGVRLAVRVTRPARAGVAAAERLPVLWHHSLTITQEPSDGTGDDASVTRAMPRLVRYGYVVVQVARRGNGQSFGERRGYHDRNEAQDAFDVTGWLSRQPWSDGKVGIYGCSNTGDAVMQALTMRPPALKAAFAGCFSWHKYDAFRRGGIFAQWGTGPTRTVAEEMKIAPVDGDPDRKLLAEAVAEHQRSTPLLQLWKSMPHRDSYAPLVASRFWAEGSAASYQDQVRLSGVPLYVTGGWRDELRDQGFITYLNIPRTRIVMGDWLHCQNPGFAMLQEARRFFDHYLKGIDTGLKGQAPINYYVTNARSGTEWRAASAWPLPGTVATAFRFGAGGTLAERAAAMRPVSFAVRYGVRCENAGEGSRVQPCHVPGSGAGFATAPLRADREVTGNALVELWASSSGPDANLFAYLEDVAPDGTVRVVTEGRLRASLRAEAPAPWAMPAGVPWHRSHGADAAAIKPGEPVRLRFEMLPTSYVFKAGHRIQVTVTGSDHRERERDIAPAPTITLFSDRARPSAVTLPVIPSR